MSFSTRNTALDDIASAINAETQALKSAKARIQAAYNNLLALPDGYSEIIDEINNLAPGDPNNDNQKGALSKLTDEFLALRTAANEGVTALASIEEY